MKAIEILAREHDERDANYDRLLRVLADVSDGRLDPSRVCVDLQARTWEVAPKPEPAPLPSAPVETLAEALAQRNGHQQQPQAAPGPLRVEGGIEGLKKLAEEAEEQGEEGGH